jgi:hypothetical protein
MNNFVMKNFINLSNPPVDAMKKHQQKVRKVIEQMGDKYCLAVHVQRKDKQNGSN